MITAPKEMVIIQEGEAGDSLFIMETGKVGVYNDDQRISLLEQGAILFDTMFDHPNITLEMMRMLSQRLRAKQGEYEHERTLKRTIILDLPAL